MNQEKQYFIAVFQLRLLSAQFGGDFGGQPPDCSLVLILLAFASDWSEQKYLGKGQLYRRVFFSAACSFVLISFFCRFLVKFHQNLFLAEFCTVWVAILLSCVKPTRSFRSNWSHNPVTRFKDLVLKGGFAQSSNTFLMQQIYSSSFQLPAYHTAASSTGSI